MENTSIHLSGRPAPVRLFIGIGPIVALVAAAFFANCASEPVSHLVSSPPPPVPTLATTTTTTTSTPVAVLAPVAGPAYVAVSPAMTTTVVTQAPPALPAEVVLAQPSSRHVWLAGNWTWRNSRYEWLAGRWEVPPSSGSVWTAPRWEQDGSAFRFYEGSWN